VFGKESIKREGAGVTRPSMHLCDFSVEIECIYVIFSSNIIVIM
jgi:hypothetical protein